MIKIYTLLLFIFTNVIFATGQTTSRSELIRLADKHLVSQESYINSCLNYVGWDYQSLFKLILIDEHFNRNLSLDKELIKGKVLSDFGYYEKLYGKEFHTVPQDVMTEVKKVENSKAKNPDYIRNIPNYQSFIVEPAIYNLWKFYGDKIPLNDTAIQVLSSLFSVSEEKKLDGLLYFSELYKKQQDGSVLVALKKFQEHSAQILSGASNANDAVKIKALAVNLYLGTTALDEVKWMNFLITFMDARKGTFSDSQLPDAKPEYLYDESVNVFGYWALLELKSRLEKE